MRAGIRSLRSLVVDIHPPNLRRTGLAAALGDLTASMTARGIAVTLVVDDGAARRSGGPAEQFAFRVAQEALRNVVAHADASTVELRLGRRAGADGDVLTLAVTDDGRGFDPATPPPDDRPAPGAPAAGRPRRRRRRADRGELGARRRDDRDDGGSGLVNATGSVAGRVTDGAVPNGAVPNRAVPNRAVPDRFGINGAGSPAAGARPAGAIRVLLVDDHALLRAGMARLLDLADDVTVVGSAGGGAEGLELAAALHPDVVLMDLSMPGMSGVEATRRLLAAHPDTAVVVLTSFADRTS